jgi:hypothetical protein
VAQVQVHQLLEQQLHMLAVEALTLTNLLLLLLAVQVEAVMVVMQTMELIKQEFLEPLIQVVVLVEDLVLLLMPQVAQVL